MENENIALQSENLTYGQLRLKASPLSQILENIKNKKKELGEKDVLRSNSKESSERE